MSEIKVSVTFRHTQPTAALKRYAEQKIQRIEKYFDHSVEAHVILSVDGRERHLAELDLHTRGTTILAKEEHHDLYAAIDLAIDKVERQITKQKEKLKLERRKSNA